MHPTPAHRPVRQRAAEPITSGATDETLLVAIRARDTGAVAELYRRYQSGARMYAHTLVKHQEVDDIVAEAFTRTLRAIRSGAGPTDHPDRYLMVVVRTTAGDAHRSSHRQVELANRLGNDRSRFAHGTAERFRDEHLDAAIQGLKARWQQILWLTDVEGWTTTEIAKLMGLTPNAVHALTYRARRALRTAYARESAAEPTHRRAL